MMERYTDKLLYAIAEKIADKCPYCPCYNDCKAKEKYIEDCVDRIYFWLHYISLDVNFEQIVKDVLVSGDY